MICPLMMQMFDPKCIEEHCAWWDKTQYGWNGCAILAIAKSLYVLAQKGGG